MIVTVIRGGLGNQMFQYAAGRALSIRTGGPLVLDTTLLQDRFPRKQISRFILDLDIFGIKPALTGFSRTAATFPVPGVWLALDMGLVGAAAIFGGTKILREKDFTNHPQMFYSQKNATLWGHWQSEKYFADIKDEIRKEFQFAIPLAGEAATVAGDIQKKNSISLHIRRGDYTLSKYVKLYGGTDLAYYERAMAYIAKNVKDPHFFIFSNDVEWCKANLKSSLPMTYVPASASGPKNTYHFELMSLCKHNIIANSTYSWWGAWLNKNPQKLVIAPANWYADNAVNDIVPDGWIKL